MFSPRQAIYLVHGAVVWVVAGLVYYFIAVAHPIQCILHPTKALVIFFLLTLFAGEVLGWGIYVVLALAIWFPKNRALHILLPLMAAGLIGAVYAGSATHAMFIQGGLTLPLRAVTLRVAAAIMLALVATPVIIIRSSRLSAKLGHSPRPAIPKDPRWA